MNKPVRRQIFSSVSRKLNLEPAFSDPAKAAIAGNIIYGSSVEFLIKPSWNPRSQAASKPASFSSLFLRWSLQRASLRTCSGQKKLENAREGKSKMESYRTVDVSKGKYQLPFQILKDQGGAKSNPQQ